MGCKCARALDLPNSEQVYKQTRSFYNQNPKKGLNTTTVLTPRCRFAEVASPACRYLLCASTGELQDAQQDQTVMFMSKSLQCFSVVLGQTVVCGFIGESKPISC